MRRHALALLTVPLASGCYQGAATDTGDGGTSTGEATTTATTASSTTAPGSSTTASTTTDAGTTTGVGPGDSSGDDGSGGGSSSTGYDPGIEGDGDYEIGPDYVDAPEIVPGEGVPRGDIYHFTMDSADSAIFPGVTGPYTRDVWVYVPQQYEDGTAAPFMLVQDGGGYRDLTSATLDTLIDAQELPAMIGIFINPGPGDGMGSERGLEYDRVSEDYTNFIETEVLPIIALQPEIAAAHPGLAFTDDPWGRATMGGSSGGACAFTMGWLRPDLYRRILTYSGTFVRQHSSDDYPNGAWEYHEHLIAEGDELPLRVFLEVGENDLNLDGNFGDGMHDWVAANYAMAAALAAKTYHYRFVFAQAAGHVDGRVLRQTLPETLRWLWRGYPVD
ncbi:MAG: enterobactin esterase [Deltaproteobacteria bacterium]|nr:enterobactin esterase [Deltaproteobacteria bacterium]MBP7287821.1 enterobactin esterase [Nannocystaceae bacterium]